MATLAFPDTKRGFRELLRQFGHTYLRLIPNYQDAGLPAFLVYKVGGSEDGVFRTDRIVVETYAEGETAVDNASAAIHSFLLAGPHDGGQYGLIDQVGVESLPVEIPQPDGFPNMVTATYRVDCRGL